MSSEPTLQCFNQQSLEFDAQNHSAMTPTKQIFLKISKLQAPIVRSCKNRPEVQATSICYNEHFGDFSIF